MQNRNYMVYRYLNKDGKIIYVGLTSRPLKQRVYEHKKEDLERETSKIQYIILPNESQMHQYEWYFIDLYKPKFNKRDKHDGVPEINTKYDGKWRDYPKNGDVKQLEDMIDILNSTVFNENQINYKVEIESGSRKNIGVIDDRHIRDDGKQYSIIRVNREDFYNNDKRFLADIIAQMAQHLAIRDGLKRASNNGIYFNKWITKYLNDYGLITRKGKYGSEIIDIDKDILNMFSQYDFGKSKIEVYTKNIGLKRPSSTRKLICPCCGRSVRDTKKDNKIICGNCYEDTGKIIYHVLSA